MMVSGLGAAEAAEIFLGPIRASAVQAVSLLVIDAAVGCPMRLLRRR
jgi:hypothetical protein